MSYKNTSSAIIRLPQPSATVFPEENVRNEVATMRYILDQTSIPVPFVLHLGIRKDGPLDPELGSFIIMEYIDHQTNTYGTMFLTFQVAHRHTWEFTYAVSVEFSCAPPWWLHIEKP